MIEIATTSSTNNADAVFHRTSAQAAWALLMIALSIVVALNLALFRHMRQAYTPARRRNPHGINSYFGRAAPRRRHNQLLLVIRLRRLY